MVGVGERSVDLTVFRMKKAIVMKYRCYRGRGTEELERCGVRRRRWAQAAASGRGAISILFLRRVGGLSGQVRCVTVDLESGPQSVSLKDVSAPVPTYPGLGVAKNSGTHNTYPTG
jgi:hypothetical protein